MATAPVGKLVARFAIPAIASGLVSSLYNIVDQIFIGNSVGMLGNAATNVAFPLVAICTAISVMIGVGGAAGFSLEMGRGNADRAGRLAGNGIVLMAISGILIAVLAGVFLEPLMLAFGSSPEVMPYAVSYTGITVLGIPFFMFSVGGCHIIRADGSPKYALFSTAAGAVLNIFLDAYFIFVLNMGIAGAALATVISQVLSGILVIGYYFRFKTIHFTKDMFRWSWKYIGRITSLGISPCINNLSMCAVQVVMNNVLREYGAQSIYGSDIPLACVGVIMKVNMLLMMTLIGIVQGAQPVLGYNYGAGNYGRVKETEKTILKAMLVVSLVAFACFQIFPRQITSIFGSGDELYFTFAEKYFRIFLSLVCVNFIQLMASNFFTSIGKARVGAFVALTRQILILLPLLLVLPSFMGIDGVMYAGPIADAIAVALSLIFLAREWRTITRLESGKSE